MIHFLSSMIISSSSAWNFAILFLSFSAFFFSYPPFCLSPSLILRLCGFFPTTLLSFFSQKLAFASLNCNRCSENPFFPFCGKVHKNVKSSSQPRGPKQDHISFFTLHLSIPKLAISFFLSFFLFFIFFIFDCHRFALLPQPHFQAELTLERVWQIVVSTLPPALTFTPVGVCPLPVWMPLLIAMSARFEHRLSFLWKLFSFEVFSANHIQTHFQKLNLFSCEFSEQRKQTCCDKHSQKTMDVSSLYFFVGINIAFHFHRS